MSRGCLVQSSHKEDSLDCLVALSYQDRKCAIFDRRFCGICLILLREVCRSSTDIMWDCYRVISKMQHNYITVSSMSRNVRKRTFRHVHPAKIQIRLHSLIRILTGFILDSQAFFFFFFFMRTRRLLITKTRLFKYIENFTNKNWKFSDKKKKDIFHISAQNIDCGYSLEPPRRGGSNEYPQSMFSSRNKKNNVYIFYKKWVLCVYWSVSLLVAHIRRYVFACCS